MSLNSVVCEALSALTGHDIKPVLKCCPIHSAIPAANLLTLQDLMRFVFAIGDLNLEGLTKFCIGEPSTENALIRKELFVPDDFFDPPYDYNFTHENDGATQFKRGNETYKRPCGWNRLALKVLDKYTDGNGWLGIGSDAWPVSYHGTSLEGAKGVIQSHYKAGQGAAYGRGIYSTPEMKTASSYSKIFTSKTTQKTYRVVLQNRINPRIRKITEKADYWLVPVPEGTPPADEMKIVESAIRPYGLLLKEVSN